jgi:hypothetical protein
MTLDTFINFNCFIFLLQKQMQVCETESELMTV